MAGRVLDAFFAAVHQHLPAYDQPLTLFGSAPVQLCLDEEFLSADAAVMVLSNAEDLRRIAGQLSRAAGVQARLMHGVQVCPPHWFRTTPHYLARAHVETRHGLRIIVPHVRDVLIGKLHRARSDGQSGLVAKDLRAFVRVRQLCGGHPDEAELLDDLRACEPFFRPPNVGEVNAFRLNVMDLWQQLFGRTLNIETEIITPVRIAIQGDASVRERLDGLRPSRD